MKTIKVSPYSSFSVPPGSMAKPGDTVILRFNNERITVTYGTDKLWRSDEGCVYGFLDGDYIGDPVVRCGVGIFSLPEGSPLNDACSAHDVAYSCPAYQINHTRKEADEMLRNHIEIIGRDSLMGLLAWPFYYLARMFGKRFWESDSTNN